MQIDFKIVCVSVQVGETSVVNVDCSRAGPGQLTLEAVPESTPTSPTGAALGSGNTLHLPVPVRLCL